GFEIGLHSHDAEETGYVITGRGETKIGDETTIIGPGDYFFFPSNTLHAIRVTEEMVFIGAMSPPRPEYKPKES
ncbi:MAG: cupin domain-containing protein, partial [Chloroflexi bacterium]|nr:cupin domain-containing protein [Chloroflexota bacterium]